MFLWSITLQDYFPYIDRFTFTFQGKGKDYIIVNLKIKLLPHYQVSNGKEYV